MQEKIAIKQMKLIDQLSIQGAKHIIWGKISAKLTKFWEYIVLIDGKISLAIMAQAKSQIIKEYLHKKPINKPHNTINFMNQISNTTLATIGVIYMFAIIIWAKKILEKHNLLNKVLDKEKQMEEEVKQFKEVLKPLYEEGLPFLGDHNGKLFSKEEYNVLLSQARMDHSKFEDLE